MQRKRRRETAEEEGDEEHSWRRELMRKRDGELELGIDRLLSDQRGRVSRSPSGSRGRDSQERHPSSGRNAGNISDGFEIPGLGRGKLPI